MTFHSSSEGKKEKHASLLNVIQRCKFVYFSNGINKPPFQKLYFSHDLLAKAKHFNMKGVCQQSFVCFLERRKDARGKHSPRGNHVIRNQLS